jgi:hypothetical protein
MIGKVYTIFGTVPATYDYNLVFSFIVMKWVPFSVGIWLVWFPLLLLVLLVAVTEVPGEVLE